MRWHNQVEFMTGQMIWALIKMLKDLLEEGLALLLTGTVFMILWDFVVPDLLSLAPISWLQAMAVVLAFRLVVRGRPVDLDIEMSPAEKDAYEREQERQRRIEAGEDPDRPSLRVIRDDDA